MLARFAPGLIAPTLSATGFTETLGTRNGSTGLAPYIYSITTTYTKPETPIGMQAALVVFRGTSSTDFGVLSGPMEVLPDDAGTSSRSPTLFPDADTILNAWYRVVYVVYPFLNQGQYIPLAQTNAFQLTAVKRSQFQVTNAFPRSASFSFLATPKCDIFFISNGGRSTSTTLPGYGGFGVAYKNITPPSGTFFYLMEAAGSDPGTFYLRRDSDISTANQILGTRANARTAVGTVTSTTGIFSSPTYATNGSTDGRSGADLQGDGPLFVSRSGALHPTRPGPGGYDGPTYFETGYYGSGAYAEFTSVTKSGEVGILHIEYYD